MSSKIIKRLVVDITSTELVSRDKELLSMPPVGGVILFARNYENPRQLKALCEAIRSLREDLVIFVDQEGGRVQRFRDGFSVLPAAKVYGDLYDDEPQRATGILRSISTLGVSELLEAGVDCNFAPVLDIDRGLNSVIGDRAFHHDFAAITILAKTYIDTASQLGMRSVAKHFPGHGGVAEDTHLNSAADERSLESLWNEDLAPFRALAHDIEGVMTTHVQFPSIDDKSATYSNIFLRRILRDELGFNGVVFSDDLVMHGADNGGNLADRAILALQAGVDVAVMCNDLDAIDIATETLALNADVPNDNVSIDTMRADWKRYNDIKPRLENLLVQARADVAHLS